MKWEDDQAVRETAQQPRGHKHRSLKQTNTPIQFLRTEGFFFSETKDNSVIVSPSFSLSHKHTSRHLFHEDLDVSVLRNGAQVLNNVPVLQVLVKGDLLMKGLGVPKSHTEKKSHREILLNVCHSFALKITFYKQECHGNFGK